LFMIHSVGRLGPFVSMVGKFELVDIGILVEDCVLCNVDTVSCCVEIHVDSSVDSNAEFEAAVLVAVDAPFDVAVGDIAKDDDKSESLPSPESSSMKKYWLAELWVLPSVIASENKFESVRFLSVSTSHSNPVTPAKFTDTKSQLVFHLSSSCEMYTPQRFWIH
jgi:hypothetical protein